MSPKSLANSTRHAGESDWDNFTGFEPLSRTGPIDADLPPPGVKRWVARRKAAVVAAVSSGAIGFEQARRRFDLSEEEFHATGDREPWRRRFADHSAANLP